MERDSSNALDLVVARLASMHLSESDFYQLFAEAIDAGRPDSEDEAELTTGVLHVPAALTADSPRWHGNPIFSIFLTTHQAEQTSTSGNNEEALSIRDQLAACKTQRDVEAVVKRGLYPVENIPRERRRADD
ncbi:hypothetical protein B0T16DRAFT_145801 [Cercophora newfieldiana]|uniref:Uncharacterized protein n=1 Tax=Cercophora newfieldiana TaxID=92897 RepID=A0AA40CQB7_9PEZI|nr:hypothetical protein B0T16DRAFT_145801 [Cercophora newfieldiana]